MKPIIGIPDIEDSLAKSKYPGNLTNFQVRITQSIIRNKADKIFASSSQEESFKTLELFYRDLLLNNLIISEEQTHFIESEPKEFLSEAILKNVGTKELESILEGFQLEPYVNTNASDKIGEIGGYNTLRNTQSSEVINNKCIAQKELRELGVLVPEGKEVSTKEDAIIYFLYLKDKGYSEVSFKRNDSINGLGVFKASDLDEFRKIIEDNLDILKKGVLIDGWLDGKIASPNIQYYVGKESNEDRLIACSDQILVDEGKEHIGNISDKNILLDNRLNSDIKKILDWIRSKKGFGVVGLDFLTTQKGSYFIEINGRYNGSTHGAVIADKLGKEFWITHDGIKAPEKDFLKFASRLEEDKQLYKDGSGIIPVNPATLESGKAMVVIVGDSKKYINNILDNLLTNG